MTEVQNKSLVMSSYSSEVLNVYLNNGSAVISSVYFDDVSSELLYLMDRIFGCVLINVLALMGLTGAFTNIIVLCSYNMTKDSSNILLISLSLADFAFCLTIPLCHSKCLISYMIDTPTAIIVDVFVSEYLSFFNRVLYYISITLTGTIAVERFLVVFFPFRIVSLLTPFRIKMLSLGVYTVNFVLASPGFFCFTHIWQFDEMYNRSLPIVTLTQFYIDYSVIIVSIVSLLYNLGVLGMSCILTLTLTPAIALKLWQVTRERQKLVQKKCSFDLQVAKILVAVCTMSLVVYSPFIFYISATVFIPNYSLISNSFKLFTIITDFSGTICASANFIIYVTMSRKFRRQYRKVFCSWASKKTISNSFTQ